MKSFFPIALLTSVLFLSTHTMAQGTAVPDDYALRTPEDYERYREQAVSTMKWLLTNPVNQNHLLRLQSNRFVSDWIKGNPNLKLPIRNDLLAEVIADQKFGYGMDFVVIYLSALALKQMSATDSVMSMLDMQLEGINRMIEAYELMQGQVKSSYLEKLVKMKEKDKLNEWMEKKVVES